MRISRSYVVLSVLWFTYLWSFSCNFIIISLLPAIQDSLLLSTTAIGLLIGAYSLGGVIGSFGSGFLCAKLGRVKVIILGVVICTTSLSLISLSTSYLPILVLQAFLGIGANTYAPAGLSILSDLFPASERGKYVGFHEMAVPTGMTLAPIVASLMIGLGLGWMRIFQVWVIPGIIILMGQLVFLRVSEVQRPQVERQPSKTGVSGAFKFGSWSLICFLSLVVALFLKNVSGSENSLLPVYWHSSLGVEIGTGAFIYGIMKVFAILGQLGLGYLSDVFGRLKVLLMIQVLTSLILIPLSYLPFGPLLWASYAGFSILSNGYMPVMFALISATTGPSEQAKMIGIVWALGATSNIISPTIIGLIAGNYSYGTAWLYPIAASFMAIPFLIFLRSRLKVNIPA